MSEKPKEKKSGKGGKGGKARIHLLDELRGVALCVMLIYHALYTLGFIFGWRPGADIINTVYPIGPYFAGIFIAVAGICSNFSHSNTDRGAKLFFLAFLNIVYRRDADRLVGIKRSVYLLGSIGLDYDVRRL